MPSTINSKSYPPETDRSKSSKVVEDSKTKTSLLQDNSWIKKDVTEDKAVDHNSNFGRTVLGRFKSFENLNSSSEKNTTTITTSTVTATSPTKKTSVQTLSKRFSASQDELDSSRFTASEQPKTSTTSTTSKNGTKTTVTTTRTSVVKTPTKAETFNFEKIITGSKTDIGSSATKTETISVTTHKGTTVREDSKTVKLMTTPTLPTKTTTSTTHTSHAPTSNTKSYTVSSKSSAEDQLFNTLIPASITSSHSTTDILSNEKSSVTGPESRTRKSYQESRPDEYFSETMVNKSMKNVSSTTDSYEQSSHRGSIKSYTTTTYTESRPEDYLSDNYTSRTVKTVYTSPDKKITERDLCTYCHKPMLSDTKMILEDVDIKCHASCFKCDVCKNSLGHLKAGDSMWVYRRTVHCEACFDVTKGKWHR